MNRIEYFNVGDEVVTVDRPRIAVRIVSKSGGSVTVDGPKVGRVPWSNGTMVRPYTPPASLPPDAPAPTEPDTPGKPAKSETAKPETDAPKPKGVDVFGVRIGSAAAAVNVYLLANPKNVTVQQVVSNVPGTKPDNVKSHLRRMVKDGLLTDSSSDPKQPVVSVPSKFLGVETSGKSRRDSGKVEEPVKQDEGKRGKRSGSGDRNEARPKDDGKAQRRSGRSAKATR